MTDRELVLKNYTLKEVVDKYGQYEVRRIGKNLRSNSFLDPGDSKNPNNKTDYDFENNRWYDPCMPEGGGIIEYVMYNLGIPNKEETVKFLKKEKGLVQPKPQLAPPINRFDKDILHYHDTLKSEKNKPIIDYLKEKGGYTDEYIDENLLGFQPTGAVTGRIIYPYFDLDEENNLYFPVSYKSRSLPVEVNNKVYPLAKRYKEITKFMYPGEDKQNGIYKGMLNLRIPYNYHRVERAGYEIYITEGNNDSDNLFMLDINNLCTSGANSTTAEDWNKYFIPILKNHKRIVILGDNDKDGRKAVKNWILEHIYDNRLFDVYVEIVPKTVEILNSDDPYTDYFGLTNKEAKKKYGDDLLKDVNDLYRKDPKLVKQLKKTRITAIEYLLRYYSEDSCNENTDNYLSNFNVNVIQKIHRHMNTSILIQQIRSLENRIIDKTTIKSIEEEIKKTPYDKTIVKELLDKNKIDKKSKAQTLIYDDRVGFYQFNGKIWEHVDDSYIRAQVNDLLGYRFANGSRINSVMTTLKSEKSLTVKNEDDLTFNKKDIMVFNNGTLYLNNGNPEFKENHFDPNDRVSFISNFDYDKTADPKDWKKFVSEITETYNKDGSINELESYKKRIMLQEYAGYILFSDCDLEKCLVMFGNGSNGKTVFFDTILSVFDKRAVTEIKAPDLSKPHTVIRLKDSLVNVSGETKNSFFGAEENIKSIVSGERQNDSFKFRDEISFRPRTKLIISANNPFSYNDNSDGMIRRFLFVHFGIKFSSNEELINKTTVKRKDISLRKRLLEQLPAVFNWMLDGYVMLKGKVSLNLSFTESNECLEQYENFKIANNPVREFILNMFVEDSIFINPNEFEENLINQPIIKNKIDMDNSDSMNSIIKNEDDSITVKLNFKNLKYSYQDYCTENGYNPRGKWRFAEEFKRQVEDLGFKFEKDKGTSRKDRGTYYLITYDYDCYKKILELIQLI